MQKHTCMQSRTMPVSKPERTRVRKKRQKENSIWKPQQRHSYLYLWKLKTDSHNECMWEFVVFSWLRLNKGTCARFRVGCGTVWFQRHNLKDNRQLFFFKYLYIYDADTIHIICLSPLTCVCLCVCVWDDSSGEGNRWWKNITLENLW